MALKNNWNTGETFTASDANNVANAIRTITTTGTFASRPAAGNPGAIYKCTDNGNEYRDNGTSWDMTALGSPRLASPLGGTTVNLGSATYTDVLDATVFTAPSNGSANSIRQRMRSLSPTSNYTITAYMDLDSVPAADFWEVGLILKNSSGGQIVMFALRYGGGRSLDVTKYNSATSYNNAYATPAVTTHPQWLRIRDDGTNRYFEYSYNGIFWTLVTSHSRTDFMTPDQYGFGGDPYSQAVSVRLRSLSLT